MGSEEPEELPTQCAAAVGPCAATHFQGFPFPPSPPTPACTGPLSSFGPATGTCCCCSSGRTTHIQTCPAPHTAQWIGDQDPANLQTPARATQHTELLLVWQQLWQGMVLDVRCAIQCWAGHRSGAPFCRCPLPRSGPAFGTGCCRSSCEKLHIQTWKVRRTARTAEGAQTPQVGF